MTATEPIYGLLAEFARPDELLEAVRAAAEAGFRKMDAYTPYPVHGMAEALGFRRSWLPLVILLGGLAGMTGGYAMQYYCAAVSYPSEIGGKPLNSWPMFIPITFELTILLGALSAVVGLFIFNGLPRLNHPVFNVPRFAACSRDRFFLCIESRDPLFEPDSCRRFLEAQSPVEIFEVPP